MKINSITIGNDDNDQKIPQNAQATKAQKISTASDEKEVEIEDLETEDETEAETGVDIEENQNEDNSFIADIEIQEIETQAGYPAIKFVSPISKQEVICFKPTNRKLLEIEKLVIQKKAEKAFLMQRLLFLHVLICKYGKKEGEKCLSINYLIDKLDVREITLLFIVINKFFRLDSIQP